MPRHGFRLRALLGAWIIAGPVRGAEPAPPPVPPAALTIRLHRPDAQCAQVLALFQGARVPHPAAALAAWKRAARTPGALGKSWDAAITAFNPAMAGELRGLDGAELVLWFGSGDGAAQWYISLPRDDGSFADLATALALTDGGPEPPLGAIAVDRLGPGPWPLAARAADRFALARSRAALERALTAAPARLANDGADLPALDSGWSIGVDPEGLGRAGPLGQRRLAEALRGLGCRSALARAGLEGETLAMTVALRLDTAPPVDATIDPAWLDSLPETGLVAAFACTIDPTDAAWARAFALADRIERADPAHADVAPLRTRINLLASTVKVRPERDLWPHLRGLSGAVLVDPAGALGGAILSLHTDGGPAAERIAMQVIPALAPLLGIRKPAATGPDAAVAPATLRLLGAIHHRPLYVSQQGATVRLGWGESALETLQPDRANLTLRRLVPPDARPPQRFGAFWPGRLALATALGSPLAATLAEAPPIVWSGRNEAPGVREAIRWPGLRDLVHHFLDRLPLDPPPAP